MKKVFGLVIFSLIIGAMIGFLEVIFGKGLLLVTSWRLSYFKYLILFLPFAGLLIEFLYTRFGGKSRQGMGLIFDVGHGKQKDIPLRLIPIVIISTWLTHLFGGSAGREGVAVQIGGTLSHWISRQKWAKYLPEKNLPHLALIIGMAAGFAGLFQTPIAATFFALEVLVVGKLEVRALLSAGIASITSFLVSSSLGLEKFSFPIKQEVVLEPRLLLKLVVLGLIFGIIGWLFSVSLNRGKLLAKKYLPNNYWRIFLGGIFLSILLVLFHSGRYAGLGSELIHESLFGGTIYSYDFALKFLLTVLTLSFGFQGGEVTPLFVIGSTLGVILAPIVGLPIEVVAAIGYVAVFGSATNTFLAPIMIGGEVFGFDLVPIFFVVMCVAYSCNWNESIYGKQEILEINEWNQKTS